MVHVYKFSFAFLCVMVSVYRVYSLGTPEAEELLLHVCMSALSRCSLSCKVFDIF